MIGTLDETRVAFLPRHTRPHDLPPHTDARLRRQPAGDPCRDAPVGTGH
jgi:hypothetical protein